MFAEIFSPQVLIVLVVVAVLFGGSRLPELARSLGSAKAEFEKGQRGDADEADEAKPKTKAKAKADDEADDEDD